MVNLTDFVFQISQPAFFYSIASLVISFLFIKIYLKIYPSISRYVQSLMWLIPLSLPACVLLLFRPQIMVKIVQTVSSKVSGYEIIAASPSVLSVTGLICLSGAIVSVGFLVLMLCFGSRIAHKRFHIVLLAPDEYADVQQKVKATAHKLSLKEPKIGLVDDLIPNAFTVGHGRSATIVFSLGLLNMLNIDEIAAVIAHEMIHIKEKDYLFKITINTLSILSFFNPLTYLTTSYAQKERELHTDTKAAALLDKPNMLSEVLTKIASVVEQFPKPSLVNMISSNLFLISPLVHKPRILLASHPKITQRIQNINLKSNSSKKHRHIIPTILLLCILTCSALMIVYSTLQIQNTIYQNGHTAIAESQKYYLYSDALGSFNPDAPTGILFPNEDSALRCISYLSDNTYPDDNATFYSTSQEYYLNCYIDARGVTYIYEAAEQQFLVINGQSVIVDGQSGNSVYPFDSLYPKPVTIVYNPTSTNYDVQYVDNNGRACFLYSDGRVSCP
ncbi:MAG: M48 family metalloprotease [Candidatus Bathyarchaeota archaeon]|uniref:M48 family metalloprotease n=1 Tax=Candidatus Bathycorpusculum sp. TaxID=2994959 RepID=UPI00281FD5F7|nr:M48 family metalloprotease [Candidatus Termiticorpusculum sp.]MCL2258041.1 M48 family metalloprotease [Candidatus Termiticorpusculum sp.]MCL2291721.1 M48 family metalloprotease [Candidatus Termiticorpusculum sp.]